MQPDHLSPAAHEIFAAVMALEPHIRGAAPAIDADRRLPPALAQDLMRAGIFRMGVPRAYGGPELDPMSQVRVVEELSRIEGAVDRFVAAHSMGDAAVADDDFDGYQHERSESNAGVHLQALLLNHQALVSIADGRLELGPWQQVMFAELDGTRPKRILIKVMGE